MRARTSKAALVAVAVVLALVACGGGNGGVATDDTAEPAGAGAEPSGGGDVTPDPGMGTPRPTGSDGAVSSDAAPSGSVTTQTRGVAGTVSDQEGPVAGALVTPTSLDTPSQAVPEVAVFSDSEGRYSWVLPAGRYRITVTADGYQEASVEAEVPARGTTTLDVRLEKN